MAQTWSCIPICFLMKKKFGHYILQYSILNYWIWRIQMHKKVLNFVFRESVPLESADDEWMTRSLGTASSPCPSRHVAPRAHLHLRAFRVRHETASLRHASREMRHLWRNRSPHYRKFVFVVILKNQRFYIRDTKYLFSIAPNHDVSSHLTHLTLRILCHWWST